MIRTRLLLRAAPHMPLAALCWVLDSLAQGAYIVFCWLDGAAQACLERFKADVTRKAERYEHSER